MIRSTARLVRMAAINSLAEQLERHGVQLESIARGANAAGRELWCVGLVLWDEDGYTPHTRTGQTAGAALELALGDLAMWQLERRRVGGPGVRRVVDMLERDA